MHVRQRFCLVVAVGLSIWLAACGGGGGGGGDPQSAEPSASTSAAFPVSAEDHVPTGARIDVSAQRLFPMGSEDSWSYARLNANGGATGSTITRRVTKGSDAAGSVTITESEAGNSFDSNYIVSTAGLQLTNPLGTVPAAVSNVVGAILEYATPLYPAGSTRRHIRSGSWGEDLDGDGVVESFRFEYAQTFVGFELARFGALDLTSVARFRNVMQLTLRPTTPGFADYSVTYTEEAWFAPKIGMVKAVRSASDSTGVTIEPTHTLGFASARVGGVDWSVTPPPATLDGQARDVPLVHNDLVYDPLRNRFYASIPDSQAQGNSIATIDPVTGQVTHSGPIGSQPDALAIAADSSALYVGLNGSGEVLKLALPGMTVLGRTRLLSDPNFGQSRAETLSVSPVDANAVAVSMASITNGQHAGVGLLRNMVMQPRVIGAEVARNLIAFDETGTGLYGFASQTSSFELSRLRVLTDGFAEDEVVASANNYHARALTISNGRAIVGNVLYNVPDLTRVGIVTSAIDCKMLRSGDLMNCLAHPDLATREGRILVVDPNTLVTSQSLVFSLAEPASTNRRLVHGRPGQVAISYSTTVRLFESGALVAPTPPITSWRITAVASPNGQLLDIALPHNALSYDSVRGRYYATVPGKVVGAGNSIATIDPTTGQVTHSASVGSEPTAIAVAPDGSALYVGLDGSGEVVKLVLPSMSIQGRTRLPIDRDFGHSIADSIVVSPSDATAIAVSMVSASSTLPGDVALLRNMAIQPLTVSASPFSIQFITFDGAGTSLYALDTQSGLRRVQVQLNGLVEQQVAPNVSFGANVGTLSFANNRVIAGRFLIDAPGLTAAGAVSGARDCLPERGGGPLLLCLAATAGQLLIADAQLFIVGSTFVYQSFEPNPPHSFLQGPPGQMGLSYRGQVGTLGPVVRLFSSAGLPR